MRRRRAPLPREVPGRGSVPRAARAAEYLVRNEQDLVLVAELANAAEVARGGNEHPGRGPADGLDNDGRNVLRAGPIDRLRERVGVIGGGAYDVDQPSFI